MFKKFVGAAAGSEARTKLTGFFNVLVEGGVS